MKSYSQSQKSKKTIASMIVSKGGVDVSAEAGESKKTAGTRGSDKDTDSEEKANGSDVELKRQLFINRMTKSPKAKPAITKEVQAKKREKVARQWADGKMNSRNAAALDYSGTTNGDSQNGDAKPAEHVQKPRHDIVGQMAGELKGVDYCEDGEIIDDQNGIDDSVENRTEGVEKPRSGFLGMLSSLVSARTLTRSDMEPVIERMRDHLIAKNVAAEVSAQMCESVAQQLDGRTLSTFQRVGSAVKDALRGALAGVISPTRRDVLRDALERKRQRGHGNKKPYVMTFCGVNGVGKSTNLAKIAFWLVENGLTVLIAAGDTFRAGAVEQLRTHVRHLNALHPPDRHAGRHMVQLYEKGYGKDAAGIAMEAINMASNSAIDIVLIDTAGRMQDNEPLMRALAKLISVNEPDLVLFVGEALVGNEAVDQLVKFNQALADNSVVKPPRLIDGIVLTKFDTIDDKVGAAVSMTYITGKPIVFVGTGQTYADLRNLNVDAVVNSLLSA